jgi:Domain of unknown function (DUF362)
MDPSHVKTRRLINRRGFLLGAGTGLVTGGAATWLALRAMPNAPSLAGAADALQPGQGMPGPFPGRVIEVQHTGSVRPDLSVNAVAVPGMVQRGMCALTGADYPTEAWRRFFEPDDVVGIKVNPVGHRWGPDRPEAISSHAVVLETVAGLKSAGVRPQNIILFERYAKQFRLAGYEKLLDERSMSGVRWYASSVEYEGRQVEIDGLDYDGARDAHVVGYDPDVFIHLDYASPEHDPKDGRRFRSHLSVIVSRMVNKIINIPVLKDHGSAGVTLALKNLSHGLNNNVARSHLPGVARGQSRSGPNQCNTFIPTVAGQPLIRQKTVLHILDGLVGVYQGGPSADRTWAYKSLFFATDPVALDHVGWVMVDDQRIRAGLPRVGRMGLQSATTAERGTEMFDRRQPEHIALAGTMGLGVFDADKIDHRRFMQTRIHSQI